MIRGRTKAAFGGETVLIPEADAGPIAVVAGTPALKTGHGSTLAEPSSRPTGHEVAAAVGDSQGPRRGTWRAVGFLAMVVVWGVAAIGLKLYAANAGAYTSDLYDFHQALRSTVEGEFFRSYVYGNVMGDHGYLILLLLVPVYWLAPSGAFWVLVVAAPVVVMASVVAVRTILVRRGQQYPNLNAVALLCIPGVFWLAHEPIYGFHPDTLAGPLLIVAAIGLGGWGSRRSDTGDRLGIAAFVLFVLLKEEMALLGVIFAIPFIIRPASRRLGIGLIVMASAVSTAAFTLMAMTRTPFNRGNGTLIDTAVDRMTMEHGLTAAIGVSLPLVAGIALVGVVLAYRRRLSAADLAVALVVAAKVASLGLVYDQIPSFSWHLAIPLAGVWYVLYRVSWLLPRPGKRRAGWVIAGTTTMLLTGVLLVDVNWYSGYERGLQDRTVNAIASLAAVDAFTPIVGHRVVSVPAHDVHAWRDREVTVLPGGVTFSPRGIGDAVITEAGGMSFTYFGPFLISAEWTGSMYLSECFTLQQATESKELYLRTADCGLSAERELFDDVEGLP